MEYYYLPYLPYLDHSQHHQYIKEKIKAYLRYKPLVTCLENNNWTLVVVCPFIHGDNIRGTPKNLDL